MAEIIRVVQIWRNMPADRGYEPYGKIEGFGVLTETRKNTGILRGERTRVTGIANVSQVVYDKEKPTSGIATLLRYGDLTLGLRKGERKIKKMQRKARRAVRREYDKKRMQMRVDELAERKRDRRRKKELKRRGG